MNEILYTMRTPAGGVLHGQPVRVQLYPDGMPLIKEWPVQPVARILLRPKTLDSLFGALFWVDALTMRGNDPIDLVIPFFPGARQDRLNSSGDYLFTAKSIASAINARNFESVTIVDPHSEVVPALLDRCKVVKPADIMQVPKGKYAAVISPDAGAEKRAGEVARKLGVPLLHAWKTRSVTDGKISGFGMEPTPWDIATAPANHLMLVVDDICDGGGTFSGLADIIALRGWKAHLFTTHGIYSQGTEKLLEKYGHLYCTDSVDGNRDGVIQIPICERLLNGNSFEGN